MILKSVQQILVKISLTNLQVAKKLPTTFLNSKTPVKQESAMATNMTLLNKL